MASYDGTSKSMEGHAQDIRYFAASSPYMESVKQRCLSKASPKAISFLDPLNYSGPCAVDASGMSEFEWKKRRKSSVGSSSVAKIFGENPYPNGTNLDLYHEMVGTTPWIPENDEDWQKLKKNMRFLGLLPRLEAEDREQALMFAKGHFAEEYLHEYTRLLYPNIVGDVDQLPSVSAGAVLDAMIASGEVKVTRLDRNFRQEAGSAIIDAAHAINAGDKNLQLNVGNFQFREISNKDITVETAQILEEVKRAFVWSMKHFGLEQTYVLAPQRKAVIKDKQTTPETLLSTQSLNPILRDIANPPAADKAFYKSGSRVFRVGDRVMNRKNTLEVLNGEIGYIKKIETIDVPVITVDYDGIEVEYTPDRLKQLDLAYAVTVHKSQGCEYDSVIYPTSLVQGMMLQRNLLYTAVTRAKRNVLTATMRV